MEGNPRFEASQQLPDVQYARFADSLGLQGICRPARRSGGGMAAGAQRYRPVVLEVKTDPEVARCRRISLKQAKAFMSSMAKGDRGMAQVISDTASCCTARVSAPLQCAGWWCRNTMPHGS